MIYIMLMHLIAPQRISLINALNLIPAVNKATYTYISRFILIALFTKYTMPITWHCVVYPENIYRQ